MNKKFLHLYLVNKTSVHDFIVRDIFFKILTKIPIYKGRNYNFRPVFMKLPIFSKMNSHTEKVLETNSHHFFKVYKLSFEHFYLGPIVWPKFAKICL